MVDESLIAYLEGQLKAKAPKLAEMEDLQSLLREVFAYTEKTHPFDEEEVEALIDAIDTCKILDPACGSGAFPMGILHKLVFILRKLDPKNERWKQKQLDKLDSVAIREELERIFENNDDDYGRKLYLIENCNLWRRYSAHSHSNRETAFFHLPHLRSARQQEQGPKLWRPPVAEPRDQVRRSQYTYFLEHREGPTIVTDRPTPAQTGEGIGDRASQTLLCPA